MQIISGMSSLFSSISYNLPTLDPQEQKICLLMRQSLLELTPEIEEGDLYEKMCHSISSQFWNKKITEECCNHFIYKIKQEMGLSEEDHEKIIKHVELYLRMENFFLEGEKITLSTENKEFLWEKVEEVVFNKSFFSLIKPNTTKENLFLKYLCIYPSIKEKFTSFYEHIRGIDDIKISLFFETILPFLLDEEQMETEVKARNGLLLYGPPGCGKKHIVTLIATTIDCPIIKYRLQSKIPIEEIFKVARQMKKSIVFIEDASSVFPDSSELGSAGFYSREINHFFETSAQLIEQAQQERILVILSSSYPEKIHPSILGLIKISKRFYIAPPDERERAELFQKALGEDFPETHRLITETQLYTRHDIRQLFTRAISRMNKLKRVISQIQLIHCVEKELSELRPSLSQPILQDFERTKRSFSSCEEPLSDYDIDRFSY